jgi:uncharacterized protein YgbK (DUF1537 family)
MAGFMSLPYLVLADDLTGAAEIAAIGVEHGLSTELATAAPERAVAADLLVVDTDSRPLDARGAAEKIARLLVRLPKAAAFFKKTDSVLRGQIAAELAAICSVLPFQRVLLVPQNPSKGRIISHGQYLIDGIPLDQTTFRQDPEYPRTSSKVIDLVAHPEHSAGWSNLDIQWLPVQLVDLASATPLPDGICIANASTSTDMKEWASRADPRTILAGGADLFRAFLETRGHPQRVVPPSADRVVRTLLVFGSASDYSRNLIASLAQRGLPLCPMPADDNEATRAEHWAQNALLCMSTGGTSILAIRRPVAPERAVSFRRCMAETVRRLLVAQSAVPLRLVVEGGATAAAISEALGWTEFQVLGNLAPGVVALRPAAAPHILLIIKPGSYPWPANFFERT